MKLEKAIETITEYLKPVSCYEEVDFRDALKLGIEALKLEQLWRVIWEERGSELLPGETKE